MKHPSIDKLALYAGRELSWWTRWTLRRHVDGCAQCQDELALFAETADAVRLQADEMPAGVQWERLAAEMRANVRLGLEASDAISAYSGGRHAAGPAQGMSWRMALVTAGLVALLSAGYWINASKRSGQIAAMRGPDPVLLEVIDGGVRMLDGNKAMSLQGPKAGRQAAVVTVSTEGSAGAQYVDEETGQITVNNVYVE